MPIPLGVLAVAGAGGAAGGGNSFDLLETQILTTNSSSITFSSLGTFSDYRHLQIRAVAKSSSVNDSNNTFSLRFNGDSGNNYWRHQLNGNGSSVLSGSSASAANNMEFLDAIVGNNVANKFSPIILDILDFNSSVKNKTVRAFSGHDGGENDVSLHSGLWSSTNSITSIELYCPGQTLQTGSRYSLYGIK